MISGTINNLNAYLSPELVKIILEFLERKDLPTLPTGKHALEKGINAIVIKSPSRSLAGKEFEIHKKNLDLHCLLSEKEILAFTPAHFLNVSTAYDTENDYMLFHHPQKYSQLELAKGQFVLFYPEDAHCAQGHLENGNAISKVVFKIPLTQVEKSKKDKQAPSMEIVQITDLEEALPALWDHDQKNQKINFPNSLPNQELFEKNVRQAKASGNAYFFYISEADKVVGSLVLRINENPYRRQKFGEIWYIYLEPECRGKGYGPKLLDFADDYFKKQGCGYAFAGIAVHNPASNILFERAGYQRTRLILEKEYNN